MNPDHALLLEAAAGRLVLPHVVDSNALARWLGTRLVSIDAAGRGLVLGFDPSSEVCQGGGVVQGGIVAAMLDFAIAFAVLLQLDAGRGTATSMLSLSFLRAAHRGPLQAHARVQRLGASMAHASADLYQDGQPVAAASAALPLFNLRNLKS